MADKRRKPSKVDQADPFWTPGLRLRSGSETMLQDEFARFQQQLGEQA